MTGRAHKVSIVIPALNEGENLVDTVHCVLENSVHPDVEIIVVDDGSTDGTGERFSSVFGNNSRVNMIRTKGVGAANARSLGATCASGEILIFLDAHCFVPPHWMDSLIQPLADPRVGMVGSAVAAMCRGHDVRSLGLTWRDMSLQPELLEQTATTPYPVPLLGGACQAVRKAELEQLGYYDNGMTRYGHEDLELCLRYWLMGYDVLVQPQSVVYHVFRESHPYEIRAQEVTYNRLRLAMLHLSNERIDRVVDYYSDTPGFTETMDCLQRSDVMSRRNELQALRCRDDDWFWTRFDCPL
ncbi:MAG: glycosyltransferase [Phycisphaerae bacterium]|nr:glycosyltransferase [Phycisphaerae bacterium]